MELQTSRSNKLFPGFASNISEDYLSAGMLLYVKNTAGWRQRNASCVPRQVAVNSRWKANS